MSGILIVVLIFFLLAGGLGGVAYFTYQKKLRRAKAIERGLKMVPILIHLPPPSSDTQGGSRDIREVMREKTAQAEVLYNLIAGTATEGFKSNFYGQRHIALELIAINGVVHFFAAVPVGMVSVVKKAIQTAYPGARLEEVEDHNIFNQDGRLAATLGGEMVLRAESAYPIATYAKLERDPMEALLTTISALDKADGVAIQIMVRPAHPGWIKRSVTIADGKRKGRAQDISFSAMDLAKAAIKSPELRRDEERARLGGGNDVSNLQLSAIEQIEEKTKHPGFEVLIRVIVSTGSVARSQQLLRDIATAFSLFETPGLNGFKFLPALDVQGLVTAFIFRFFPPELKSNILNSAELATLFHLPDSQFTPTTSVEREQSKQVDGPIRLPAVGLLFGFNDFRGVKKEIRLSLEDRRRHTYILGQTGTGKSTMLENLAVQDMLNGNGFAFIDPHGDSAEKLLAMVPKERAEDVIYFNPADMEYPVGLNLFEFTDPSQKDFIVQETISMLYKLYDPGHTGIIGPRYEHWYRNAALTLMSDPNGSTFIEIPKVFTDTEYLKQKFKYLRDPTVIDFWTKEMGQTSDYHKSEMLGWFVSKFGAFQNNEMMRNIIGQTKSSFNLRDVMDQKKILIVNLSKGRIGELNSQLLGMIFVIKFQAAAMSRADTPEEQRPDFSLYVDEFQNFSTDSFASILSEARKYRLNLIVANQFIGQLSTEIRDAVFGNIGSIVAHRMGPDDAEFMTKQFAPVFDASDLVNIPNYNAAMRLMIGGLPSQPFSLKDSAPLGSPNLELGLAIKQLSAAKYGHSKAQVEADLLDRLSGHVPAPAPDAAVAAAAPVTAGPAPAIGPAPAVAPAVGPAPVVAGTVGPPVGAAPAAPAVPATVEPAVGIAPAPTAAPVSVTAPVAALPVAAAPVPAAGIVGPPTGGIAPPITLPAQSVVPPAPLPMQDTAGTGITLAAGMMAGTAAPAPAVETTVGVVAPVIGEVRPYGPAQSTAIAASPVQLNDMAAAPPPIGAPPVGGLPVDQAGVPLGQNTAGEAIYAPAPIIPEDDFDDAGVPTGDLSLSQSSDSPLTALATGLPVPVAEASSLALPPIGAPPIEPPARVASPSDPSTLSLNDITGGKPMPQILDSPPPIPIGTGVPLENDPFANIEVLGESTTQPEPAGNQAEEPVREPSPLDNVPLIPGDAPEAPLPPISAPMNTAQKDGAGIVPAVAQPVTYEPSAVESMPDEPAGVESAPQIPDELAEPIPREVTMDAAPVEPAETVNEIAETPEAASSVAAIAAEPELAAEPEPVVEPSAPEEPLIHFVDPAAETLLNGPDPSDADNVTISEDGPSLEGLPTGVAVTPPLPLAPAALPPMSAVMPPESVQAIAPPAPVIPPAPVVAVIPVAPVIAPPVAVQQPVAPPAPIVPAAVVGSSLDLTVAAQDEPQAVSTPAPAGPASTLLATPLSNMASTPPPIGSMPVDMAAPAAVSAPVVAPVVAAVQTKSQDAEIAEVSDAASVPDLNVGLVEAFATAPPPPPVVEKAPADEAPKFDGIESVSDMLEEDKQKIADKEAAEAPAAAEVPAETAKVPSAAAETPAETASNNDNASVKSKELPVEDVQEQAAKDAVSEPAPEASPAPAEEKSNESLTPAKQIEKVEHEIDDLLSVSLIKPQSSSGGHHRLPEPVDSAKSENEPEVPAIEQAPKAHNAAKVDPRAAIKPAEHHTMKVIQPLEPILPSKEAFAKELEEMKASESLAATAKPSVPMPQPQTPKPPQPVSPAPKPTVPAVTQEPVPAAEKPKTSVEVPKLAAPGTSGPVKPAAQVTPVAKTQPIQPVKQLQQPSTPTSPVVQESVEIQKHPGHMMEPKLESLDAEAPPENPLMGQGEDAGLPEAVSLAADDVAKANAVKEAGQVQAEGARDRYQQESTVKTPAQSLAADPSVDNKRKRKRGAHHHDKPAEKVETAERIESEAEAEHNRPTEAGAEQALMAGKLILPTGEKPLSSPELPKNEKPKNLAPGEVYVDDKGNVVTGD